MSDLTDCRGMEACTVPALMAIRRTAPNGWGKPNDGPNLRRKKQLGATGSPEFAEG
jgi:hypothetical protein